MYNYNWNNEEELLKRLDKIEDEMKSEFEEHSEYCEAQGWPSWGSNYDLMCEQTRNSYADEIDFIYRRLDLLKEG